MPIYYKWNSVNPTSLVKLLLFCLKHISDSNTSEHESVSTRYLTGSTKPTSFNYLSWCKDLEQPFYCSINFLRLNTATWTKDKKKWRDGNWIIWIPPVLSKSLRTDRVSQKQMWPLQVLLFRANSEWTATVRKVRQGENTCSWVEMGLLPYKCYIMERLLNAKNALCNVHIMYIL